MTGSLKAAFTSAAISYATASVFKAVGGKFTGKGGFFDAGVKNGFRHILSHALVGGVSSVLRGGKFGHGFFSAGITKGLTPHFEGIGGSDFEVNGYNIAEATIAGVLGGTISQATGGKFANGAITAAMGNLFNNQASRIRLQEQRARVQARYNDVARWAVQIGFKGGWKAIKGLEGDAGFYVGVNENREIDWGTYQTLTGVLSSEYGTELGLQVAYGDVYTNDLDGQSVGGSGGLDTPVLDVDVGLEAVAGGTIYNLSITVGPEVSALGVVGYGQEINQTWTQRLNR